MDVKQKIIEIIGKVTGVDNIEEVLSQEDLTEAGVNSVSFIKVIVGCENEFGIEFDDDELDFTKYNDLDALSDFVEKKIAEKAE